MRFIHSAFISLVFVLSIGSASCNERQFYDSLVRSIETAHAQSYLYLDNGTWRSTIRNIDVIWRIRSADGTSVRAKAELNYERQQLTHGYIEFPQNSPLRVTLIKTVGGQKYCTTFIITRLEYTEGGVIDDGRSSLRREAVPDCPRQAGIADLDRVAALAPQAISVFKGRTFKALTSEAVTVRCQDADCKKTVGDTGPITAVRFFGFNNVVTFQAGSSLLLPSGGFLRLEPGSRLQIATLDYDLLQELGSASLSELRLFLQEGRIETGQTIFDLKAGSRLEFKQAVLEKDGQRLNMFGGALLGSLGDKTIISLNENKDVPSRIYVEGADADFSGLEISVDGKQRSVKAAYASLDLRIRGADLSFSSQNSLKLGYTGLKLALGCDNPVGPSKDCPAVSWAGNNVVMVGRIPAFNSELTGGRFAISGAAGSVVLQQGTVSADNLTLDTRDKETPIQGSFKKFFLVVSAQTVAIDKETSVKAGRLEITSNDLTFVTGDRYPSGSMYVAGTLSGSTGGGAFGSIPFVSADLKAWFFRKPKDEIRIHDGQLDSVSSVRASGGASAEIAASLRNIRYYRGLGEAKFDFEIRKATYPFTTPGARTKEDGSFGDVFVELKAIDMVLSQKKPMSASNLDVKVVDGNWSVPPVNLILEIGFGFRNIELIYALAKSDLGIIEPKCAMKLKFMEANYTVTANVRVALGQDAKSFTVDNVSLDRPIEFDPDLGSCDDVIEVVCFIAGNAIFPVLGGVAAGILCDKIIDKKVEELTGRLSQMTKEKISQLRFAANF